MTFGAASPRVWSCLPSNSLKAEREGPTLSCFHVLLGGQIRVSSREAASGWCSSSLGRKTGQRQLDQWWHLISSVSVSVCPYSKPKYILETLEQILLASRNSKWYVFLCFNFKNVMHSWTSYYLRFLSSIYIV